MMIEKEIVRIFPVIQDVSMKILIEIDEKNISKVLAEERKENIEEEIRE
jgi:hypothetical protein